MVATISVGTAPEFVVVDRTDTLCLRCEHGLDGGNLAGTVSDTESPDGKYFYVPVAVEGGSDIVVIDTATQKIKKTISLTSFPDAASIVFNRSGRIAYVTGFNLLTGLGSVAEMDTAT